MNIAKKPQTSQIIRTQDVDGWRIYEQSGEKYLSVTLILSCVVHEKLQAWFKKNSANAISKRSTETAQIGTDIHKMVEDSANNADVAIPKALEQHNKQWEMLRDRYQIRPIESEFLVTHKHGFAGQVDLYADTIYGKTILDVKSGRTTVQAGWQLAAYRLAALASGRPVDAMAVLSIPRDGSKASLFKYEHIDFCTQRFLCALECFRGLYWKKLDDMGMDWKTFTPSQYEWGDER